MMLVTRPRAAPVVPAKPATKIAVKTAGKAKAPPPDTPSRRLRLTSSNTASDKSHMVARAKLHIEEQLKVISKYESAIDVATAQITQANRIIEAELQLADLTHHTDGVYLAEIVEMWSNQSRDINPEKYRNRVSNEIFWATIEVSLTKAKAHLTEKEINEIADVVPSKFKGRVLKIKKMEPKRRAKVTSE